MLYSNKHVHILLALVIAIACYYLNHPRIYDLAQWVSEIFVRLLKLVSIPMVFLSIVSTLSGLEGESELVALSKKIAFYTLTTTMIAATTALAIYCLVDPSKNTNSESLTTHQFTFKHADKASGSFILDMIPSNVIQTFLDSNVVGVVIIAFLVGISTLNIAKAKRQLLNQLFSSIFDVMLKIAVMVLRFIPIAVWAFVLEFLHSSANNKHTGALFWYLVCIAAANAIQAVIILPTLLKIHGVSPLETFRGSSPALITAFFSKSSSATMPATLKCAQKLGITDKTSTFSIPMCTTINMNACAAFILITVLFVAELNGYVFSFFDLLMWIVLATIAAVGNAGVPMGCYFMSITYLIAMDIPLNIMGLILPVYTIIDMFETAINVWSDICITRIVDKNAKR